MACSSIVLQGLNGVCKSVGGIKDVYIILKEELGAVTYNASNPLVIETITTNNSARFNHYVVKPSVSDYTSEMTADNAANTAYYTNTVNLQFSKLDQERSLELWALAQDDVVLAFKDNNDDKTFRIVGITDTATVNTHNEATGTAKGDFNGYNMSIVEESNKPALYVAAAILEPLF